MFYWLIDLSNTVPGFGIFRSFLNVFRYITFRTGGAMLTGALFVFLFGPWIIDHLRLRQGKGQPIRIDGPQSHLLTKKGTATMGGLMILSGLVVATLLWANPLNPYVWIVLAVTLGFGFVGFYDDYLKVTQQTHSGFAGRVRLSIEALIALAACYALTRLGRDPFSTSLVVPFFKDVILNFGWFFVLFGAFIMVDSGSLALGGMLGASAVAVKHEIGLAVIGGLFVLEAVSVIVQVVSFRLTGKRVFRMAPLHNHFEQKGWTEPQIVIRFWIISVMLALAGLSTLKLR